MGEKNMACEPRKKYPTKGHFLFLYESKFGL